MRSLLVALLCLAAAGVPRTQKVIGSARAGSAPVAEAVVWIDAPDAPPFVQRSKIVLDQRNMQFVPHVLAVRVGSRVDFPNHDRVFHDVFSFRDGKTFDLGLYPVGAVRVVTFDRAGLSRVFCNIHPHMAAYVMAVDTPYFAVTDASGAFAIPDVPARAATYHAWRPGGTTLTGTVDLAAESRLDVDWK